MYYYFFNKNGTVLISHSISIYLLIPFRVKKILRRSEIAIIVIYAKSKVKRSRSRNKKRRSREKKHR